MANRVQPEAPVAKAGPRPRVAIVGAGAAGLVSAYLLETECDVVLLEASSRLGGHADTIEVKKDGKMLGLIDGGAMFIPSEKYYPDFFRLLDILGVGVIERSATICAFDPASGQRGVTVLPPPFLINGHGWLKGIHDLGKATALFQLLLHGRKLLERGDNVTTVEEAIAQLHNTQEKREFLLGLMQGINPGPDKATTRKAVASNIFSYASELLTRPLTSTTMHVKGGMSAYVRVLASRLQATTVRLNARVQALQRLSSGQYALQLTSADGAGPGDDLGGFDHVVVATEPLSAQQLLATLPAAAALHGAIAGITGEWTTIALHSDTRFMPRHAADWAEVNFFPDAQSGEMITSAYAQWEEGDPRVPVFKTWLTHSQSLQPDPNKTHYTTKYWHPYVDRAYMEAQGKLAVVNGKEGVWLAGLYTNGFASHNSAVASGIAVAQALAPGTPRLQQLLERPDNLQRGQGCCLCCC